MRQGIANSMACRRLTRFGTIRLYGGRMKDTYLIAIDLYQAARRAGKPTDYCMCCGAVVAESVKGCWEAFTGLSERAYSEPIIMAAHFYGVDAHALQHPEIHGRKNNAAH